MTLLDEKRALRARMRTTLAAIPREVRAQRAQAIVQPLLARAGEGPVALFASMGDELDTTALDEALRHRGIVRVLPQVAGSDLVFRALPASVTVSELPRAAFGAPSPTVDFVVIELKRCAAVVVPGLAFDEHGWRIGYGKGFYDRALADVDLARVVGVGYDEQIIEAVPHGPSDVRLTMLCTPSRGVFAVV